MTTWRKEIMKRMIDNEDKDVKNYVCTLTEEELDVEFDEGYGIPFGKPFTLWTTWHVYFPVCYDGSEWCGSVYRNPTKIATSWGGGMGFGKMLIEHFNVGAVPSVINEAKFVRELVQRSRACGLDE